MLSLSDFYSQFCDEIGQSGRPVVFLQVINSKGAYVRSVLKELKILDELDYEENSTSEILAILGALGGIDNLPRYLEDVPKVGDIRYVQIHLPYEISMDDINGLYKGELKDKLSPQVVQAIKEKNDSLQYILFPGGDRSKACVPQLARLLTAKTNHYFDIIASSDWFRSDIENRIADSLSAPRNGIRCSGERVVMQHGASDRMHDEMGLAE